MIVTNILHVMEERVLPSDKMNEMARSFAKLEEKEIGLNKHEEFHATLNALFVDENIFKNLAEIIQSLKVSASKFN